MLNHYISLLSESQINSLKQSSSLKTLFHSTHFLREQEINLEAYDLVIVGVQEDRFKADYEGCANGPDAIRKELYKLVKPRTELRILDLGNIAAGNSLADTYFALTQTLSILHKQKKISLVLGGSQDLIAAQYASFKGFGGCQNGYGNE